MFYCNRTCSSVNEACLRSIDNALRSIDNVSCGFNCRFSGNPNDSSGLKIRSVLLLAASFKTNYSEPLRQPEVDLAYRVYLKHRNSISENSKASDRASDRLTHPDRGD